MSARVTLQGQDIIRKIDLKKADETQRQFLKVRAKEVAKAIQSHGNRDFAELIALQLLEDGEHLPPGAVERELIKRSRDS